MEMTLDWFGRAKPKQRDLRAKEPKAPAGPGLRSLLDKRDDHLLRDAGLTRDDLGALDSNWVLWPERSRHRGLWEL